MQNCVTTITLAVLVNGAQQNLPNSERLETMGSLVSFFVQSLCIWYVYNVESVVRSGKSLGGERGAWFVHKSFTVFR